MEWKYKIGDRVRYISRYEKICWGRVESQVVMQCSGESWEAVAAPGYLIRWCRDGRPGLVLERALVLAVSQELINEA